MSEITQLLARAAQGETAASNQVMPMIYEQLCTLAHRQLGDRPQRHTLSTTDLVHEAYLALFGANELEWHDRSHFFSYAARTMRNILVDRARRRLVNKRAGEGDRVDFAGTSIGIDGESIALLELDKALTRMEAKYPRLVRVVELRFFAGRSVQQTAALLRVDSNAVERDWRKARAFLTLDLGHAS